MNDYHKKTHFYSPYIINKYFKGLNYFDIEHFVNNPPPLIDEEYINKMIENENCSKEITVDKLNEKVMEKSFILYSVIIKSIEEVVEIEKFNKKLRKSIPLKKHRDKFSIDSFISNIK